MNELFDENKLAQEIETTWGPHGAHAEIYHGLRTRLTTVEQDLSAEKAKRVEAENICSELRDTSMLDTARAESAERRAEAAEKERDGYKGQLKSVVEKIYTSEDFADAVSLSKPGRLLPLDDEGNLSAQGVTVLVHGICTAVARALAAESTAKESAALVEEMRAGFNEIVSYRNSDQAEQLMTRVAVRLLALTPASALKITRGQRLMLESMKSNESYARLLAERIASDKSVPWTQEDLDWSASYLSAHGASALKSREAEKCACEKRPITCAHHVSDDGHWLSPSNECHGFNSQPGDRWVNFKNDSQEAPR